MALWVLSHPSVSQTNHRKVGACAGFPAFVGEEDGGVVHPYFSGPVMVKKTMSVSLSK